jgi:trimethylamine:corrinoid methyltransferase-like protein
MADRAVEKAGEILRHHEPEALPESVQKELVRIRRHAESRLKDVKFQA